MPSRIMRWINEPWSLDPVLLIFLTQVGTGLFQLIALVPRWQKI